MAKRRAVISVYHKDGIVPFAAELTALGWEVVSTGGTANLLRERQVEVIAVSEVTGFPEVLGGRVKTIHPVIAAGILARRDVPNDMAQLAEHGIEPIDLVVVNLYPFEEKLKVPGITEPDILEEIDIGGVTLIREAAKNYPHVLVVTDSSQYGKVIDYLKAGEDSLEFRRQLAQAAFHNTAWYDTIIDRWFTGQPENPLLPERLILPFELKKKLRYGENPHQNTAGLYQEPGFDFPSAVTAEQVWGKNPSCTTVGDLNAGVETVRELLGLKKLAAVVIKHNTPCGVAIGNTPVETYVKAREADPLSAFGGVIACNFPIDPPTAEEICSIKVDGVIATGFTDPQALELIKKKRAKGQTPVFTIPELVPLPPGFMNLKPVVGGIVYQETDLAPIATNEWTTVTEKQVPEEHWSDIVFGWLTIKHVKSNSIIVVKDGQTLGIGSGQTSRIGSALIALNQAREKGKAKGAILVSDALCPFDDVVTNAAKYGIVTVVQTGGSINDQASIEAADKFGLSMVFTHKRAFWH